MIRETVTKKCKKQLDFDFLLGVYALATSHAKYRLDTCGVRLRGFRFRVGGHG